MKKPRQSSIESDLISGQVHFAQNAAFVTASIAVTPPLRLSRKDIVSVSIDEFDSGGTFTQNVVPLGGINPTGQIVIWLMNLTGAPVFLEDTYVNYIVSPRDSSP
jgi:hypothetical protein